MLKFKTYEQIYCAFCRSPRRVEKKKHVTIGNYIETLVLSLLMMWIFWENLDFRFFPIWFSLIIVSEILINLRWRMSLVCKTCGFDPIVYSRSKERAAEMVKSRLEARRSDPTFLLSKSANIQLPHRKKSGEIVAARPMSSLKGEMKELN